MCKEYRLTWIMWCEENYNIKYNVKINGSKDTLLNGIIIDNELFSKIASKYGYREEIRDLYNICFIVNNFWDKLDIRVRAEIEEVVLRKEEDYFKYLIYTHHDDFVDSEQLEIDSIKMYKKITSRTQMSEHMELDLSKCTIE